MSYYRGDYKTIDWGMADVLLKKEKMRIDGTLKQPITPKQHRFIKSLERRHNVKFTGRTREEASHFIGKHKYKKPI